MVILLIESALSLDGSGPWSAHTARHLGLESTLRSPGRPPKKKR